MVELINSYPDFSGALGDKRLEKRAADVLNRLTLGRTSSVRQITQTEAQQKSFYRLLNNENFSEKGIQECIVNRCGQLCSGRHVLCIEDSSEFNLTNQKGRIKAKSGLGRTAKDDVLGFMLHSSLVIDASRTTALGYSYIKMWQRDQDGPDRYERNYQQLPFEEKESYKWKEATLKSSELLTDAEKITVIADRESDIYDLLASDYGDKVKFVIRSNFNRQTLSGTKLVEHLNNLAPMHQYDLEVRGDVRKKMEKRTANMLLKWDKVWLVKPKRSTDPNLPESKEIYIIEAKENRKNGLLWRIYTTHPVINAFEAMQIIEWYKQRWYIEQIHRLLKTDGFRIERSQLEQGWAIRKLTLLAMMATLRILQMMLAYEDDSEEQSINEVFDREEQKCLDMLNKKLQGKTNKTKNTSSHTSLRWAVWVIARLGGWKGYKSQRKPGPIVLQKGLAKFYQVFEGWNLYQKFQKEMSTQ
jgi:hypothetical protein